ncbi:hypothetical protein M9H77_30501 [Catharanthus roseus]|uniref:Uncharacterized protein n=1 Tax=Catharanthus roseus TaxID=4058 RepID=A0ACB9ZY96_CATRO|nr:hypothetical protein M9H77_30501 [Catharanthus roseus]
MDILMGQEIYTIYDDQKAAQECYFSTVQEVEREDKSTDDSQTPKLKPDGKYKLFVLHQSKPKQTMQIGKALLIDLGSSSKTPDTWTLNTNGSARENTKGASFILEDPDGHQYAYAMKFLFPVSNNEGEYEALLFVNEKDGKHVLCEIHEGICGSHIVSQALVTKIIRDLAYILINLSRGLHCAWLVPRTRASSERHAWDHFLPGWFRRDSPARVVQGHLGALGFTLVLTTGCRNLFPITPFKVSVSVC